MARRRSRPTASGLEKSKRRRSGSTLLPACWACLPRMPCRAWCSRWSPSGRGGSLPRSASTVGTDLGVQVHRSFHHPADVEGEIVVFLGVLAPRTKTLHLGSCRCRRPARPIRRRTVSDRGSERPADRAVTGRRRVGEPVLLDDADHARRPRWPVAEKFVAVVIFLLECIERPDGKHGRGLGRFPRDPPSGFYARARIRTIDPEVVVGRQAFDHLNGMP